jgi:hypothetical protein
MVSVLAGAVVLLGLYAARLHNYLLFHSLAEVFSVVVACSVFLVAWNARRSQDNHYFLFVGIAYLFAGVVDLVHMLGYKGMGVFPGYDANLPTQLWIGARYLQAISLLIAPRFAGRSLDPKSALAGYAVAVFLLSPPFSRAFSRIAICPTRVSPPSRSPANTRSVGSSWLRSSCCTQSANTSRGTFSG